ncbi:MAG TPA: YeeE/YedE thiosulfate transporter family protein [Spirochaetota bacterium]|nr:YeeE/YedE thiosulfate transporter family protein [Spirochaetota bacterium]
MAPYDVVVIFGKVVGYLIYLLIGVGFGAVLELSGFGDSRKLSAQFYLTEMRVLKVMFTAIVVAMLLIFLFNSFGLLNFENIWVNPTFLWSQIIGGLIMGVGFIIGGFCPGTSLVAASTLKLDGVFFVLGALFGVFLLGESISIPILDELYYAGDMGRFMLSDLFGLPVGVVVFLVILLALTFFYGAEILERIFGGKMKFKDIDLAPHRLLNPIFMGVLILIAAIIMIKGEPSLEKKWQMLPEIERVKLEKKEVFIHPAELLELMNDFQLKVHTLDLRSESDYNIFHIYRAQNISKEKIMSYEFVKDALTEPSNSIFVLVSNNGDDLADVYKYLKIKGVANLYVLDGGVNNWLRIFSPDLSVAVAKSDSTEGMNFIFNAAYGSSLYISNPWDGYSKFEAGKDYIKKVKIQKKAAKSGGCG